MASLTEILGLSTGKKCCVCQQDTGCGGTPPSDPCFTCDGEMCIRHVAPRTQQQGSSLPPFFCTNCRPTTITRHFSSPGVQISTNGGRQIISAVSEAVPAGATVSVNAVHTSVQLTEGASDQDVANAKSFMDFTSQFNGRAEVYGIAPGAQVGGNVSGTAALFEISFKPRKKY